MTGRIFLINDETSGLVSMQESDYDSEALLQELLAKHPDLLAGDQMDINEPRRWLLVAREMAVPDEEDRCGRWSLDHLFLDQDAIPTLVEVKRGTDTRIRREVIGQMLDYAANAVCYWPLEKIRARFEGRCEAEGSDPNEELDKLLGGGKDTSEFWQSVKTNLQAGRVRMIFVADRIPSELRRIVEFLNEQMDPAEVLAVEIKQYAGQGMKTLVPRVLGLTEAARQRKDVNEPSKRQWDEASFFDELARRCGDSAANTARRLLDWARARNLRIWWGQGLKNGSFFPLFDCATGKHFLFSVWTSGSVEIQFQQMTRPPFDAEAKRKELADRLQRITGLVIPEISLTNRPSANLTLLVTPACTNQFLAAFDWVLGEVRQAVAGVTE